MKRFFTTFFGVACAGVVTVFLCYYLFVRAFNSHIPTNISYNVQYNSNPSHPQGEKRKTAVKSTQQLVDVPKPIIENGFESYFCRLTDFYQVIIGMLSTLIVIILALVFLYSIKMSKAHVEETLESEKYNRELEQKVQALLLKLNTGKEDEMAGLSAEIEELRAQCDLLGKNISDKEDKLENKNEVK